MQRFIVRYKGFIVGSATVEHPVGAILQLAAAGRLNAFRHADADPDHPDTIDVDGTRFDLRGISIENPT